MRVLVAVKRVIDYAVKVRVNAAAAGGTGAVETANVKMSINPFCAIAVEEAVRLKEKKIAKEVVTVSVGPKQAEETIRAAAAIGADRGVLIKTDLAPDRDLQPLAVAKLLKYVSQREDPSLILLGKQSIDGDYGQTGPILAGLLNWPQVSMASDIVVAEDGKSATVTREIDSGLQTVKVPLPAVITCDLRLNEPRYATLPNIRKARKKTIEQVDIADTDVDVTPRLETLRVIEPPTREAGVIVESVDQLIDKLKTEARVLDV